MIGRSTGRVGGGKGEREGDGWRRGKGGRREVAWERG